MSIKQSIKLILIVFGWFLSNFRFSRTEPRSFKLNLTKFPVVFLLHKPYINYRIQIQ